MGTMLYVQAAYPSAAGCWLGSTGIGPLFFRFLSRSVQYSFWRIPAAAAGYIMKFWRDHRSAAPGQQGPVCEEVVVSRGARPPAAARYWGGRPAPATAHLKCAGRHAAACCGGVRPAAHRQQHVRRAVYGAVLDQAVVAMPCGVCTLPVRRHNADCSSHPVYWSSCD